MKEYLADLHIHTVLSPCGDLNMSPAKIVEQAVSKGIGIIGLTDHNSTKHCRLVKKLSAEKGIFTLMGAEVTTREEVHCLTFFENTDTLGEMQSFLDSRLPDIKNDPDFFGYQVVVDENENVVYIEEKLLTNAIDASIDEIEQFVHQLGGIFIPAHIDRYKNSIYSQLGLFPDNLKADALEISWRCQPADFIKAHPEISGFTILTSSDAHFPENIGRVTSCFTIEEPSFSEIRAAIRGENNRKVSLK